VILELEDKGEFASFETIVHNAFTLCPEKFGFKKYPQWPDSLAIDRRLRDMRNPKGLIEGKAKLGFQLTPYGRSNAERIMKLAKSGASQGTIKPTKYGEPEYNVLNYTLQHALFRDFASSWSAESWTKEQVYDFLKLPLEAPKRVALEKLSRFIHSVEAFDRKDVVGFMTELREFTGRLR